MKKEPQRRRTLGLSKDKGNKRGGSGTGTSILPRAHDFLPVKMHISALEHRVAFMESTIF